MGFIDKFCGKLGLMEEIEDEPVREEPNTQKSAARPTPQPTPKAPPTPQVPLPDNVVDIQSLANNQLRANGKMKVIVIEPQSFDDVQQVADCLKDKKPVVLNFEKTDSEVAHRIIDFLSGTTYALAGNVKRLAHNVLLCAPSNVNVSYTQERSSSADMSWLKK